MTIEWIDAIPQLSEPSLIVTPIPGLDYDDHIPHNDVPDETYDLDIMLPDWQGEAYFYSQGLREDIVDFLRELAIAMGVEFLMGNSGPNQETWNHGSNLHYSLTELQLGNYAKDLATGQTAETGYRDIPLTSFGPGSHIGHDFHPNGDVTTYFTQDRDNNGYIDVVYKNENGTWFKAETTTNGAPNWQPSGPPPRLTNPYEEVEEVDE